jgi:hypothetical protein
MRLTSTHTFATLEVSAAAYDEIKAKLVEAEYQHAFIDDAIDMHGIGLVKAELSSTWITAYDFGGSNIEPRQHFHCARCGTRQVVEGLTRTGFDLAAKEFIGVHRECKAGDSDATGDAQTAAEGKSGLLGGDGFVHV